MGLSGVCVYVRTYVCVSERERAEGRTDPQLCVLRSVVLFRARKPRRSHLTYHLIVSTGTLPANPEFPSSQTQQPDAAAQPAPVGGGLIPHTP